MDEAAPIIYARGNRREGISLRARMFALVVGLGCLSVLIVAAMLKPSPRGFGSHTKLGLAQCQFMERTGLPCPSCGMTTSWTWFARGNLAASLYVQPMGTVLAAIAGCCVWAGLYVALTGRPVYRLLLLLPGRYYFIPLMSFAILAWAWKIFIHLNGMDGWPRH